MSDRTRALLDRTVQPGEHEFEFYARWATEIEKGEMSRNAARFWSQGNRQELLRPCYSMEDILADWDDDEHGEQPEEGDAAWLDDETLSGECEFIYMDPVLVLPADGFFAEPLPSPAADEREEELRTIALAELLDEADLAHFDRVSAEKLYPDAAPSTWQCRNGWKGNSGQITVAVAQAVTLRELLRAQPLSASVWVERHEGGGGGTQASVASATVHFEGITVGEDGFVEWENSNGKSSDFEVAPPDNMRLWRLAGTAIGRLVCLLRRASERVYAPGGAGVEGVRQEFEALAERTGACTND